MAGRNVGVIGLGAMGLGVARSLLRAGFRTHACDVRKDVLDSARRLTFPLPLTATAHQMFLATSAHGHGGEDTRR